MPSFRALLWLSPLVRSASRCVAHSLNMRGNVRIQLPCALNCFRLRSFNRTRSFRACTPNGVVALRTAFNVDSLVSHVQCPIY